MIDKDQAKNNAMQYVARMSPKDNPAVIVEDQIIEEDFGWIFYYQSALYIESRDSRHILYGNVPIIVSKQDGAIYLTGSQYPIQHYIAVFQKQLDAQKSFISRILYRITTKPRDRLQKANSYGG